MDGRKVRNLVAQRRVANRLMTVPAGACPQGAWPWRLKKTPKSLMTWLFQRPRPFLHTSGSHLHIITIFSIRSNQSSMQVAQEIFYISLLNSSKSIHSTDPPFQK